MKTNPVLILAPMAGFTDAPYRLLARKYGADETVSEMISAIAITYRDKKTAELCNIPEGDDACYLQLFGHDPRIMGEAAELLLSGKVCDFSCPPAGIDINMGCPVRKIHSNGDGSALLEKPDLISEITYSVKNICEKYSLPLSVKMRIGSGNINISETVAAAVSGGADRVSVHLRTREEMYRKGIHTECIPEIKAAVGDKAELILNGDILNGEDARSMLDYGCDGLMIGRAALSRPWIFDEIRCAFGGRQFKEPDNDTKLNEAIALVRAEVALKGEKRAIPESRSRAAYFIQGMRGAAEARRALNAAVTLSEFETEIEKLRCGNIN